MDQKMVTRRSSRTEMHGRKSQSNDIKKINDRHSLSMGSVRVIVTATDPKYSSHVFLRKYKDSIESILKDWCRLENVPPSGVDLLCGNRCLSNNRRLCDIEESYPGIIDIICVPTRRDSLRVLVSIQNEQTENEADPFIFLCKREDSVRTLKLDIARHLTMESSQVRLSCEGSEIAQNALIGSLKEKWPGIIDLRGEVSNSRDANVQCHVKDQDTDTQTEMSRFTQQKYLHTASQKKSEKMFPSECTRVRVGSMVLFHTSNPSDTLGTIIDEVRSSNLLISVSDIKLNGNSLWSASWMEKRLLDCQLTKDDELSFQLKKQFVHVELYTPPSLTPQEWTLEVPHDESCWGTIATRVTELARFIAEGGIVVVQYGLYFLRNGFWRRAVHSLNVDNGKKGFYAEEDGEPIEEFEGDHLICELLTYTSGIRGAPDVAPILTVLDKAEVMHMARAKGPDQPLPTAAATDLFDPRALLLLRGLRLRTTDNADRLFLLLAGYPAYCDVSNGAIIEDLPAFASAKQGRWSEAFILLREGEMLPRWPIPFGRHVRLLRRHGVDIQVSCDRLVRRHTPGPRPTDSVWMRPTEIDQFLHSVSVGIRRIFDHQIF